MRNSAAAAAMTVEIGSVMGRSISFPTLFESSVKWSVMLAQMGGAIPPSRRNT
jgi:Mn2+/Fe2+ NRAMP family transporter